MLTVVGDCLTAGWATNCPSGIAIKIYLDLYLDCVLQSPKAQAAIAEVHYIHSWQKHSLLLLLLLLLMAVNRSLVGYVRHHLSS